MQLGKTSSDDLVLLLNLYPKMMGKEFEEARQILIDDEPIFFSADAIKTSWCQLYELPATEHIARVLAGVAGEEMLQDHVQAPNKIRAIEPSVNKFIAEFDAWQPTEDEKTELKNSLQLVFGLTLSVINTLRCLLTFGSYLNDMITKVRAGGKGADLALLRAVRIDPTVLGCPSVIIRISRAVMLDDQKFLDNVRKAMSGKFSKREQRTYQHMRLVLQVLYETGAPKLDKGDLYALFREELNIVRDEAGEGDVKEALRQFAYQFMKEKSVSEKP